MTLHQHFRHGDRIELVPARKDKTTGECYTREKDVQRVFLDATLFKVKGAVLYEPKRIAYYPGDTIEAAITDLAYASIRPGASLPPSTSFHTIKKSTRPIQMLSTLELNPAVSTLSLQSVLSTLTDKLVRTSLQPLLPPPSSLYLIQRCYPSASIHRPPYDDAPDHSVRHYNTPAATRTIRRPTVRPPPPANEQAESKIKEEQMLNIQQETIDRLIVNQQRVDALLVQNYELHEYPIPRLFVVLPTLSRIGTPGTFCKSATVSSNWSNYSSN
ncbi:MAG: hypothetical protein JOS17DRAFT_819976 [Linnemannia elongata]|nr:MAG: hypothetical protein JOS17DRAFT_819976 [Linnemannia elongata]